MNKSYKNVQNYLFMIKKNIFIILRFVRENVLFFFENCTVLYGYKIEKLYGLCGFILVKMYGFFRKALATLYFWTQSCPPFSDIKILLNPGGYLYAPGGYLYAPGGETLDFHTHGKFHNTQLFARGFLLPFNTNEWLPSFQLFWINERSFFPC